MTNRGRPPRVPRAQQMQELLDAARFVFDERGFDDAQMDDIASAAGISKAGIYRHFASKEELRVSAVVVYLDELGDLLEDVPVRGEPVEELLEVASRYLRYGIDHPAFVDCCLALLRRPAEVLAQEVSLATMLRLTQAMARTLGVLVGILERGREAGALSIDDPDVWANYWYARALGSLHLARIGVILCPEGSGLPRLRAIGTEELERIALEDMLADVGVRAPHETVLAWRRERGQTP